MAAPRSLVLSSMRFDAGLAQIGCIQITTRQNKSIGKAALEKWVPLDGACGVVASVWEVGFQWNMKVLKLLAGGRLDARVHILVHVIPDALELGDLAVVIHVDRAVGW